MSRARERRAAAAPPALPPMTRGPLFLVALVAAACAVALVTFRIYDPDLWQHLLVGKTIWAAHAVPSTQLWTWPTHGAPDVLPSWLFRALLWPFWQVGGLAGVFVWRWLTTLVIFGFLFAAVRRMGATGVAPLLMLVWCVLFWRQRSQARPETFAAILLAAELLLLETRRRLGANASPRLLWGLLPIALLWANAHISWYLGLLVAGAYLCDDLLRRREGRDPRALALAMLAMLAVSFVNPFGWRALWQPFEYLLYWRKEPVFQSIDELGPIDWSLNMNNGLPLWFLFMLYGIVASWRDKRPDLAQTLLVLYALAQAFMSQRFLGFASVIVAPFAARELGVLVGRVRWPNMLRAPWPRAAAVVLAMVGLVTPSLTSSVSGFGYGLEPAQMPVRACDWMERHEVRGRGFNVFNFGGYLLWRFYPDPGRLPFMDIHQAGTPRIRYEYAYALQDTTAWRVLENKFRFDWVVLPRRLAGQPDLIDFLDADREHWALVFADDAGALWLRRDGALAALAAREAYPLMPAGLVALGPLGARANADAALRDSLRAETRRAIADSPEHGRASALAAQVELTEGRMDSALVHAREAARLLPLEPGVQDLLGLAAYHSGDPATALAAWRREARNVELWPERDLRFGTALAALGRREEARRAYERSLARQPALTEARDSLEALSRR